MNPIDQQATERVRNARGELIMTRRFYGVLVMNVEPVLSRDFPTMATDGKRHFFNPEFVMGLSKNHLGVAVPPQRLMLGVQAHESEHDARHHGTRRGDRDPVEWNISTDYAINIDLIDQGFDLPEGALIDPKYRGMSAEDIYRSRELDAQKAKPQPKPDADDELYDSDQPQEQEQGAEPDGDDADSQDEGEGQNVGVSQDDEGTHGTSSGDPGQCGEVLDAATDANGLAEADLAWEKITQQAATMARLAGELPDHVAREIERAQNAPRDWRDELREYCEQGALRIETWNRPNRRFMGRGMVLPSAQKDGIGKAAFVIDTSGSMDVPSLASVRNEAQAMLDDGVIDEAVVIYCNTRVTREDTFATGDDLTFDPLCGGGTDLKPAFAHIAEHHPDASVLICFTDLFIGDAGPEPHCPVLFAVTGYPDTVRDLIARAPWGARGIDVGAR